MPALPGGNRGDFRGAPPRGKFGLPSTQYPTPNVEDEGIIEERDFNVENYARLLPGTPHPQVANAFLVYEQVDPPDAKDRKVKRVYRTDPTLAQEPYNAQTKFGEQAGTYPCHIRRYLLRRPWTPQLPSAAGSLPVPLGRVISLKLTAGGSGYPQNPLNGTPLTTVTITATSPDTGTGATGIVQTGAGGEIVAIQLTSGGSGYLTNAPTVTIAGGSGSGATATAQIQTNLEYLVEEFAEPAEGELLSLFDHVTRIYRTLPGPIVSTYRNHEVPGFLIRTDRQAVPTVLPNGVFSVPPEAVGVILSGDVKQSSITEAELITETVANADGTTASGLPIKQVPALRDPDTGVLIFEDIFTAVPGYQLPITYTPAAISTASGLFNFSDASQEIEMQTLVPYDRSLTGWAATGPGMAANTIVTNQEGNNLWLNNATTSSGTLAGLTFYPPVFSSYNDWPQPNNSLIGYSNSSYDPPRYPIFAESSPNEGSANLTVRVKYCQIPEAMLRDESEGYEFPAIYDYDSDLFIPNNYGGQHRPPWPIGADQIGGYTFVAHRQAVFPVRKITTYSLGETKAIPTVYRVVTPGAASKIFHIPTNCIAPKLSVSETFIANGGTVTQLIENFASSTPSSYNPNEILVIKAQERRWRGNIWIQEIWFAGENVPPSAMPDPIANGYYKATKYPTATSPALVNFNALNAPLFAWTAGGSTPNVTAYGNDVPTAQLGSLVDTIAAVAVNTTPNFTPDTYFAVSEILLDSPVPSGDSCTVYAGYTPQAGSVLFTGLPATGDTITVSNGEGAVTGLSATNGYTALTATFTSSSANVTVASTAGLTVGMLAVDLDFGSTTYVPVGTTINTVVDSTHLILSSTAATSGPESFYFGNFYSEQPALTIAGGGGSGATGVLVGQILTVGVAYSSIWLNSGATLTSPGIGYTSAPAVYVSGNGGGSGIAVTATQGSAEWVYTFTDASFTNQGGQSAVALASVLPTTSAVAAERQQAALFSQSVNGVGAPLPCTLVRASLSSSNGRLVNLYGLDLEASGASGPSALSLSVSGSVATLAANLGVSSATIVTQGTGLTIGTITVPVPAQNGGIAASLHAVASGYVSAIGVSTGGYGYTNGAAVTITPTSGGSGATATIVATTGSGGTGTGNLSGGGVNSISVTAAGSGYVNGSPSTGCVVVITGNGTGASYTATVSGGIVTGFNRVSAGSGYTGTVTAAVYSGIIQSVTVTAGGSGYNSGASASISGGTGGGLGTVTTPVGLTSVTVAVMGTNYTSVPTVTSPGGGSAITVSLGVDAVYIAEQGTATYNPSSLPSVVFTGGGGSGAAASVSLLVNGQPTQFSVTNDGSGYTSVPTATLTGGTIIGTSWATLNQFVPGQLGPIVATIPAGSDLAFRGASKSFPRQLTFQNPALADGAPDAEQKATLNLPAAEVFYSDWMLFPAGEDVSLEVIVAGTPSIRVSYELSSQNPAMPLVQTPFYGNTFSIGSKVVGGTGFQTGDIGCAVFVGDVNSTGGDPYENEIVDATHLLRPYRGATGGAQTIYVQQGYPAYQIAASQIIGGTNGQGCVPLSADIGTPSAQFIRYKFQPVWQSGWSTPTPGAFTWRSVHAAVSWIVFPN